MREQLKLLQMGNEAGAVIVNVSGSPTDALATISEVQVRKNRKISFF